MSKLSTFPWEIDTAGCHYPRDGYCSWGIVQVGDGVYTLSTENVEGLFTGTLGECKAWAEGWEHSYERAMKETNQVIPKL